MNSQKTLSEMAAALRRQWLDVSLVLAIGVALAAAVFVFGHPSFAATSTLLMVTESPSYGTQHASLLSAKPVAALDLASIVSSDAVLIKFRSGLGEDVTIDKLRQRIRAKINGESTVMPIQYTDVSEEGAIRGSNMLANDVTNFYRDLTTKRLDLVITELRQQTETHAHNLARLDARLQKTARAYPYNDVQSDDRSVYARLMALGIERDDLVATIAADESTAHASSGFLSNARPQAYRDVVQNDPVYTNVRAAYAKDVAELKRLQSYGSAQYPGLAELADIVRRDRVTVAKAAKEASAQGLASDTAYAAALDTMTKSGGEVASQKSKLAEINSQINRLDADVSNGGIGITVAQIRRQRDHEQDLYGAFETRLMQAVADRAEAASFGSLQVMDGAQMARVAIWSTRTFLMVAVMLVAGWLAFMLGLYRDRADTRSRTPADIESVYGSRVIGSLS